MNSLEEVKVSFEGVIIPGAQISLYGPTNGASPSLHEAISVVESSPGHYHAGFVLPEGKYKPGSKWRLFALDLKNPMNSAERSLEVHLEQAPATGPAGKVGGAAEGTPPSPPQNRSTASGKPPSPAATNQVENVGNRISGGNRSLRSLAVTESNPSRLIEIAEEGVDQIREVFKSVKGELESLDSILSLLDAQVDSMRRELAALTIQIERQTREVRGPVVTVREEIREIDVTETISVDQFADFSTVVADTSHIEGSKVIAEVELASERDSKHEFVLEEQSLNDTPSTATANIQRTRSPKVPQGKK